MVRLILEDGWILDESDRGLWVSFDDYALDCVPNLSVGLYNISEGVYLIRGQSCELPLVEADEDGIVFMPAYLTESEYESTKYMMEF